MPPFLCRRPYRPLTRPAPKTKPLELPVWTLGGDYEVMMARVAQRLRCPLWVVGEMPIQDYLDEADAYSFLVDQDNPPIFEVHQ